MSKIKMRSSFATKIWISIGILLVGAVLIYFSVRIISKSMNNLAYDLGEMSNIKDYRDVIIVNYNEYLEIVKKYNIEQNLDANNFENHDYVVSFQEYDPCGESKFKEIDNIEIKDTIKITYKIHNKCGWCKKHLALHLIKIDKLKDEKLITYDYTYAKKLNCGEVK